MRNLFGEEIFRKPMARNFGIPEQVRRFWSQQTDELHAETRWAFVAIGAFVFIVIACGILFS